MQGRTHLGANGKPYLVLEPPLDLPFHLGAIIKTKRSYTFYLCISTFGFTNVLTLYTSETHKPIQGISQNYSSFLTSVLPISIHAEYIDI